MNRSTPALGLELHQSQQPREPRVLTTIVEAMPDGGLRLDFRLQASPDGVRLPPTAPAVQTDSLWQHTCFEAFLAVEGQAAYREFNFSPSGAWAMYTFADYRRPVEPPLAASGKPTIACAWVEGEFRLIAHIAPADLPLHGDGQALMMGLCAVIEEADGSLSYWALRHRPDRPDFHARDAFALRLPADMQRATAQAREMP